MVLSKIDGTNCVFSLFLFLFASFYDEILDIDVMRLGHEEVGRNLIFFGTRFVLWIGVSLSFV